MTMFVMHNQDHLTGMDVMPSRLWMQQCRCASAALS